MRNLRIAAAVLAAAALAVIPVSTARAAGTCVATDNGAANPGPNCGPYNFPAIAGSSVDVENDVWNPPGAGHPQTIRVTDPGHFTATDDYVGTGTAVHSYPHTGTIFTTTSDQPDPLSHFHGLSSDYSVTNPGAGDWDSAYDIWAGTGSNNYAQEIMVWAASRIQNPSGSGATRRGVVTFYGVRYELWSTADHGLVTWQHIAGATSGRVHLLAMLDWLMSHGYMPRGSGLNAVQFGWEVCNTGSRAATFTLHGYDVHAS